MDRLFGEGKSFFEFPFRVVALQAGESEIFPKGYPCQVMISVSKRNFKKAVERNRIKRLVREAYRRQKSPLLDHLQKQNTNLALALIYTGKKMPGYQHLEPKIIRIIDRLIQEIKSENNSLHYE